MRIQPPLTVWRRCALALAALVLLTANAEALSLRRLTLAERVAESGRIVHGTVVEAVGGRDEAGIPATWITVDVARTLKGAAERRVTFKQLGRSDRADDGNVLRIADLPVYHVGDEIVLLLRTPSRRGFTSPVGFADGVYRVEHASGTARVREPADDGSKALDALLAEIAALVRDQR